MPLPGRIPGPLPVEELRDFDPMNTTTTRQLPAELLRRPVTGINLPGPTLGDVLGQGPTLLAFLRHFG